jgi:F420-dependent oxidoreductase-like protein
MRLSTALDYSKGPRELATRAQALEAAGIDIAWVAEAYTFDAPSLMGYLAAVTERVQIGAGILPIYSRTPTLMAMTAAGIDALSEGRCILGLGASGPQVIEGWHGVPYDRPLQRTREIIEVCRQVWAREAPLTYQGKAYTVPLPPEQGTGLGKALKIINRPVRARIPIWVAALGEKNVAMTAELAEGWLPLFFVPEKTQLAFGSALAEGKAKRDPSLGELEIGCGGMLAITDDADEIDRLRNMARPQTALYVGGMGAVGRNFYNALVSRYGWEAEARTIQELYLGGQKAEAEAAVPDELLEKTSLVGPEGYIKDRLAAYREAGVTVLNISPMGADPMGSVARLKELAS